LAYFYEVPCLDRDFIWRVMNIMKFDKTIQDLLLFFSLFEITFTGRWREI